MCRHQWKGQHVLIGLPLTLPFLSLLSHSRFFTDLPPLPHTRSSLLPASVLLYIYLPTLTSLLIFIALITPQFTHSPPLLPFVTLFNPLLISTDQNTDAWCIIAVRLKPRVLCSLHLHNPTAKLCALRSNMGNPEAEWMRSVSTLLRWVWYPKQRLPKYICVFLYNNIFKIGKIEFKNKQKKTKLVFWSPDHVSQWMFLVEVTNEDFHLISYRINKGPHGAPLFKTTCTQTPPAVFYFHTISKCTFGYEWFAK